MWKPWQRHCEDTPAPKYLNYLEELRKGCRPLSQSITLRKQVLALLLLIFSSASLFQFENLFKLMLLFPQVLGFLLLVFLLWFFGIFFERRKQASKFHFEKALCVSSGTIFSAHHGHVYLCCVGLTWALLSYLQSNFGPEAELQVFAHCPSAWPTHDLYSKFLLKSRKQGWYPAPLYSLAYPPALQTKAPSSVGCEGDCWDLGTKHRLLKAGTEKWLNFTPAKNRDECTPASLGQQSDKPSYHPLRVMPVHQLISK